jgi:hypothetical protein
MCGGGYGVCVQANRELNEEPKAAFARITEVLKTSGLPPEKKREKIADVRRFMELDKSVCCVCCVLLVLWWLLVYLHIHARIASAMLCRVPCCVVCV